MTDFFAKFFEHSDNESSDSSSDSEYDSEPESPLVKHKKVIELLPGARNTLSAQAASGNGPKKGELKADAISPLDLTVTLPKDYKPGHAIKTKDPLGEISLMPPVDARPGSKHTFRLDVPPDMKVTVPKGVHEGEPLIFERSDGQMISVEVPLGKCPGDTFTVAPPALMVKIPDAAKPGDVLVFKNKCIEGAPKLLRVQLPTNAKVNPSGYIGARVPFEAGRQVESKTEC